MAEPPVSLEVIMTWLIVLWMMATIATAVASAYLTWSTNPEERLHAAGHVSPPSRGELTETPDQRNRRAVQRRMTPPASAT